MTAAQKVYRPVGRVVTRRIGGDNLLVPVSGAAAGENAIFPINDTGLFIWERLSAGKPVEEVSKALTEQFDVDFSVASADSEELLRRLVDQNLLQEVFE